MNAKSPLEPRAPSPAATSQPKAVDSDASAAVALAEQAPKAGIAPAVCRNAFEVATENQDNAFARSVRAWAVAGRPECDVAIFADLSPGALPVLGHSCVLRTSSHLKIVLDWALETKSQYSPYPSSPITAVLCPLPPGVIYVVNLNVDAEHLNILVKYLYDYDHVAAVNRASNMVMLYSVADQMDLLQLSSSAFGSIETEARWMSSQAFFHTFAQREVLRHPHVCRVYCDILCERYTELGHSKWFASFATSLCNSNDDEARGVCCWLMWQLSTQGMPTSLRPPIFRNGRAAPDRRPSRDPFTPWSWESRW
ncbi:hypothetical protein IE81DRAFT_344611 [Ceraceosorus guamensis]|uniref:BTB domain-containing protein n=1 Tax=Ceraceosorus guamensis TaxID=1522189 RepID=A0A316W777_9BASI|nr:hypothetical protein IE81DRAFT_344611 [Ceraceosorus guamensis]PWN45717.1 hypothetical protein IE81DRAFT_344611 [Ceraceosorus guamensis]